MTLKKTTKKTVRKVAPKTAKTAVKKVSPKVVHSLGRASRVHILKRPHITEKATLLGQSNVYVFRIASDATKRDIITTVKDMFGVTPIAVRTVAATSKTVRSRRSGIPGIKRFAKKAYVTLKHGDSITI